MTMNLGRYNTNSKLIQNAPGISDDGAAWLITYTDIITLVVALFVVMLANSTIGNNLKPASEDMTKAERFERSQQVQGIFLDGLGQMAHKYKEDKAYEQWKQEKEKIERLIRSAGISDQAHVEASASGITLRFEDNIFFESGAANLDDSGRDILKKFLGVFQRPGLEVVVQGHTDNVPINTARFPSNWELSASRASEVARYLIEFGSDPELIHIEAYADTQPVAGNDEYEGRQKNRRVEIVLKRAAQ